MASRNAKLTFLRLIGEHDGEWGWYQFERAFPPGWFADEPPATRAKDVLDRLESDGLVTTVRDERRWNYRLTDQGAALLREAAISAGPA